jgi:hypothetical protein
VIKSLIAANPAGELLGAHQSQSDRRDRRSEKDACSSSRALRRGNERERRNGKIIDAPVTTKAATTMIARLAWLASVSAPAGVCAMIPQRPVMVITRPILSSAQWRSVKR